MKIFKFPLRVDDVQQIEMPKGSRILCVQMWGRVPCVWAQGNPDEPLEPRCIETFTTDHDLDDSERRYIGTYQLEQAQLVFHVFEKSK